MMSSKWNGLAGAGMRTDETGIEAPEGTIFMEASNGGTSKSSIRMTTSVLNPTVLGIPHFKETPKYLV